MSIAFSGYFAARQDSIRSLGGGRPAGTQAAQEMWSELLADRSDLLLRSFEIADERGHILLTLPFREVLERTRKPTTPLPKLRQFLHAKLEKQEC